MIDYTQERYEVVADFPLNPHKVGRILHGDLSAGGTKHLSDYPHLFRKMAWWEGRKGEDMPEYLSCGNKVGRVTEWHIAKKKPVTIDTWATVGQFGWGVNVCLPATLEEYQQYIQSK